MANNIARVHCFFEQSGTFKWAFINQGIPAFDYDIQNNFGQTDYQINLFAEIEKCYSGGASIFDDIGKDDLIMAFFPCIYFETFSQMIISGDSNYMKKRTVEDNWSERIKRIEMRDKYYMILQKLFAICEIRGLRLILENPAAYPSFILYPQNFPTPTFIDRNRALRGDNYRKPTAYWFVGITPTYGMSYNENTDVKIIMKTKSTSPTGMCSEKRSMISPEYAKNFIADFILGVPNENTLPSLF